jgi:multidrug resistance efflux pump
MSAAALTVVVTGTGAWHSFQTVGLAGTPASAVEDETEPILSHGYVDIEPGLTRLVPVRPGKVMAVPVRENQQVEAGEVLLRLDDEPARLLVRQAQAELTEARDRLEEARRLPRQHRARSAQQRAAAEAAHARRDAMRRQHERLQRLAAKQLCGEDEAKSAADELRAAEAVVRVETERLADLELSDPSLPVSRAEALVDARKAQLKQAEHALRQCVLRAPERGTVLRVLVRPGEVLTEVSIQPAFWFCPARPRIIRAEVSQEKAGRVAPGQFVQIEDDGDPSLHWRGKVQRVSDWCTRRRPIFQEPMDVQDVLSVECIIEPEGAPHLRIGQKVRVTIAAGP